MTTTEENIQYRVVTKDLVFSGYTVLEEGQLAKIKEMVDGTYFLMNHPIGYGGFSSKSEMKTYTRKAKKKDIKRIKKQFINEEVQTSLEELQARQQEMHNMIEDNFSVADTLSETGIDLLLEDLEVSLQSEINRVKYLLSDYVEYINMKPKELETETVLYLQQ